MPQTTRRPATAFVYSSVAAILACSSPIAGCAGSNADAAPGSDAGVTGDVPPTDAPTTQGATVSFDLDADFTSDKAFFDFPYPSDLRLTARGTPEGRAFPNPLDKELVANLRAVASERAGYPVVPGGYFKFSRPLAPREEDAVFPADKTSPVLLVDVDDASPDRGALVPTIAVTLPTEDYVPPNVLAVAPRPGFVLHGRRTYAFVVLRSLGDDKGQPLVAQPILTSLLDPASPGTPPATAPSRRFDAAKKLYAPLARTLRDRLSIDPRDVAAATVFTTGDVVVDLAELSDRVLAKYSVEITGVKVEPVKGAKQERYCALSATVRYPQFQRGKPPFSKDGLFDLSDLSDGDAARPLPKKQRDEDAPVAITLPKRPMPAGGYPLVVYFHGSGGLSTSLVDRGPWAPTESAAGCPEKKLDTWAGKTGCNKGGEGPAHVVAAHGFAMAGSALPVNPERVRGARETEYLNFNNLAAFRDTFRQGVIEQRLFIEALRKLRIPADVVAACSGLSLPAGESTYHFAADLITAQGQSMGGMYTNIIGAVEPRIKAVVPTGAGGYWSYFITKTKLFDDTAALIAALLGVEAKLSFLHPTLQLLETAWEPSDPLVYMPRLAKRPLAGHPVRSIYEPAGKDDSYFPPVVYDAVALAYGHPQAGDLVWPSMQQALGLAGLQGARAYPIKQNLKSANGAAYTGAVVQYAGDGVYDPHAIYSQLDAVKYQYGCFLSTFFATGAATIPAPAPLGTPCSR